MGQIVKVDSDELEYACRFRTVNKKLGKPLCMRPIIMKYYEEDGYSLIRNSPDRKECNMNICPLLYSKEGDIKK